MDLRKLSFAAFCLTFLLFFNFSVAGQDAAAADPAGEAAAPNPEVLAGEKVFKRDCATCHAVKTKVTGPALMGAEDRWIANGDFDGVSGREWLNRWVRNSPEVLATGHPYANKIYLEYNKTAMTPFPSLTDEEIANVFAFVKFEATKKPVKKDDKIVGPDYTVYVLYALVAILLIVVLALGSFLGKLGVKVLEKQGLPIPAPVPVYKNKKLITTIGLVVVIFISYSAVNTAIDLGRQQGYGPEQPIKYSHALHAGVNGIDCKYCHTGAPNGKHANIPSMNVCMNCHKGIKGDNPKNAVHGRKEITKIYASIGFDPEKGAYIPNYSSMPEADAKKLFTDWLNQDEQKPTPQQIDDVLKYINKPIDWKKIHNLPDHVYFNHSQHVAVAGLECQTCHGPIETMEVVSQFAPLSMGWCVNCHRTTDVNFAGNKFYDDYHVLHEQLKNNKIKSITVETIGGTECQKCHY